MENKNLNGRVRNLKIIIRKLFFLFSLKFRCKEENFISENLITFAQIETGFPGLFQI